MSEVNELAAKLARRTQINEGEAQGEMKSSKIFNPYTEFPELTRKQIKEYEKMFKEYDVSKDGFIDLMELKLMMEKLGAPQTHIGLKAMIKEVDEDFDGQMNFREFLIIFKKAALGELQVEGLKFLASSINVSEEGVKGAKGFFEAQADKLAQSSKFEKEIKAEQEENRRKAEEAAQRKAEFKAKMAHLQ